MQLVAGTAQLSAALRILFTVHGYKPAWRYGGPAVSVPALAEALVRRGHEVTVFTTNWNLDRVLDVEPNRPHELDGVQVWYFEKEEPLQRLFPRVSYLSKSMGTLYSPRMKAALDELVPRVDLVHTHLPFIYPTFAGARAARRHGKPLFYNQRGVLDPERLKFRALKKRLYMRFVEIPIMRGATTLIALTEAEVASYRSLGLKTKCAVVPNGIIVPPPRRAAQLTGSGELAGLGIQPHHSVVLFMSRVHPVKGADKLLAAFIGLARRFPDALLVLAGPDEFDLERTFRAKTSAAGLEGRVLFPGMVEGDLKRRLLERANLFCLPSDAEGFSMAILEALAAGTAVLISPGCHFNEVEDACVGKVVAPTIEAVGEGLATLLGDLPRLADMGRLATEFVRERYSWDRVTDSMLEAYEEGIMRSHASARYG